MYRIRTFQNISEAIEKLNKLLDKRGKKVYVERVNKWTKELIGISFRIKSIDYYLSYYKDRKANEEFESAFIDALSKLYKFRDTSARYLIGFPKVNYHYPFDPCLIGIQLLFRNKPIVIVYMRSLDIKEFPHDFSVIARKLFILFGNGEIIFHIGSLHKYLDEDDKDENNNR